MILWKWNALERRTYPVSLWHPMSSGRMRWVLFVASMLRLTRTVPAAPVGRGDSSAVAVNTAVSSDRWRGIAERYLWCTTHWHRVPGAASWAPAAGLRVAAGAGDAYDTIYRSRTCNVHAWSESTSRRQNLTKTGYFGPIKYT